MSNPTGQFRGWVTQSADRGSLDIITSCAVTVFLCIWTSVCANVPDPDHGAWELLVDRLQIFCLGLAGPEFILLGACGQWCSASASVTTFAKPGYTDWTMKHAFFADMGAVHLQVEGMKTFPVNAKQLHLLVSGKHIAYPSGITIDLIDDKNKSDGLAR